MQWLCLSLLSKFETFPEPFFIFCDIDVFVEKRPVDFQNVTICLILFNLERALKELYKLTVSPAFPFSPEILIYSDFCPYHSSKIAFFQVISDLHVTKFNGQFSVLFLSNLLAEFARIHLLLLFESTMLSSRGSLHIAISFIPFLNDLFY